jgi:hypothetical protein
VALLAGPLKAVGFPQPALDLVGQLEQVGDVLGGVVELLGGQWPRVPARVAGGLADSAAQHRAQQVAVASLGAGTGEAGRDLRVEHVDDVGVPDATEDRDVLTTGVERHLDVRIREQLGERHRVVVALDRVDDEDPHAVGRAWIVDRHLHEAQERAVAPL